MMKSTVLILACLTVSVICMHPSNWPKSTNNLQTVQTLKKTNDATTNIESSVETKTSIDWIPEKCSVPSD